MNTLYLGKLEHADPLYEILSGMPYAKNLFSCNNMSNRSVYKYTKRGPALPRFVNLN
jgi:hypothetical protein